MKLAILFIIHIEFSWIVLPLLSPFLRISIVLRDLLVLICISFMQTIYNFILKKNNYVAIRLVYTLLSVLNCFNYYSLYKHNKFEEFIQFFPFFKIFSHLGKKKRALENINNLPKSFSTISSSYQVQICKNTLSLEDKCMLFH